MKRTTYHLPRTGNPIADALAEAYERETARADHVWPQDELAGLSPEQVAALHAILDADDKRSQRPERPNDLDWFDLYFEELRDRRGLPAGSATIAAALLTVTEAVREVRP